MGSGGITRKRKRRMLRIAIAASALLFASGAFAQELTAAQRDACMGDYEKYCKSVVRAAGASSPALPRKATS